MQFNNKASVALMAGALFLVGSAGLPGAETGKGPALQQLSRNQRLPLPDNTEVTGIAASDQSVWFLAVDRSADRATPVVYSWSVEGIRQYWLPGDESERLQSPVLSASRAGQVLLLQAGRLWTATDSTFAALPSFSKSPVARVTAGADGFWAMTMDGDLYYLASLATVARKIGHADGTVTAMATTSQGDLWYASANGRLTLVRRDGSTGETLKGSTEASVSALFADASEQLWAAYSDGRVARFVGGATDWFSADEGLPGGIATQIAADAYGNLMLNFGGSEAETAWLMSQPRSLRTNLGVQFRRYPLDGLTGAVRTLAVDHLGGTWVSVGTRGAFRLQGLAEVNWPRGAALSKNDVDKAISRNAAIAGAAAKIVEVKPATSSVSTFPILPGAKLTVLNSSKGLPKDYISCIVPDQAKNVYLTSGHFGFGPDADQDNSPANAGGVVFKYDHRSFTPLALPAASAYQACAWDAGTSHIWFGGTNGVSKYNPSTGAISSFLSGQVVMEIAVRGGELFVAAFSGVYRLSTATGATLQTYASPDLNRTTSIAFDPGGTMYIGTGNATDGTQKTNGVYKWNGAAFERETQNIANNSWIHDIEFDNAGNLWVGQKYGAIYRRTPGGTWTAINVGPNVAGFYRVYRINKDSAGNLWLNHFNFGAAGTPNAGSTFIAAGQVGAANPTPVLYGTAVGLPTNAITWVAEENGAYWFGSPGGGAWRAGGPYDQAGFPRALTAFPHNSSPLLVDLDYDGKLDIVTADTSGRIYAFKHDGTPLWTVNVSVAVPLLPAQVRAGVTLGATFGNPAVDSSAAAGDVDGDGEIDIVIGVGARAPGVNPGQGGIVVISRLGVVKRFIYSFDIRAFVDPQNSKDGFTESVYATPVLANIDSDPELEIMAGALDNLLYAWNGDGSLAYQKDDDNDGKLDEDGFGDQTPYTPFNFDDDFPGIRFVDDNGDGLVDNSSAADDDEDTLLDEDYPEWPFNARDTVLASAVAWDINGDGTKELIFGHDYSGGVNQEFARGGVLRVLTPQGQQVAGFPKGNLEQVVWSSPVVVDLDNDGQYEIIHGTGLDLSDVSGVVNGNAVGQLVHAWRASGAPYIAANANGKLANVEGRSFASFAVGDLDNDNIPELVIITSPMFDALGVNLLASGSPAPNPQTDTAGQKLYVFDVNGNVKPGFPVRPVPFVANAFAESSPILVDVDGDGFLDIITGVRKGPIVFDRFGHVLPGMGPFESLEDDNGGLSYTSTAAYADIDNDGNGELVWSVPAANDIAGSLRVVKLGAMTSSYNRSWPQGRRTVNRNAVFGPILSVVQGWETSGTLNLRVQAFGARTPLATIAANLAAVGGSGALALTPTFNSYYTGTQSVAALAAGRYEIPVTITDGSGKTDTQTLIFIKRGGTKSLAFSNTTLGFGTLTQGASATRQLTMTNLGSQAMTISSITTTDPTQFIADVQNTPVATRFSWTGKQLPVSLGPGESFTINVRFRPSATAGARGANLIVNSDDAAGARTVTLNGFATTGSIGCSVTLDVPATLGILPKGEAKVISVTPSVGGCQWVGNRDVEWVSMFNDVTFGKIYLTVYPNLTVAPRTARLNINGNVVVIYQGSSAALTEVQRYVAFLYFSFFGRYPSDPEIAGHVSILGASPTDAQRRDRALFFLNSEEFNNAGKFSAGLYVGLLNRDAEYPGWLFQRNALATGLTNPTSMVSAFLGTAEYLLKYPNQTRDQFVTMLYNQVLLRPPSPSEITLQTNEINRMVTQDSRTENFARTIIASGFLNSAEFRQGTGPRLFAFLLYALMIQRDPTTPEFENFKARIQANGTVLGDLILEQLGRYESRRTVL